MEIALLPELVLSQSVAFQLVLFRLVAFCVVVPYIGAKYIPKRLGLFFAISFALVLTPRVVEMNPIDLSAVDVPLAIMQNMVVGFLYGASLLLIFEIIGIAGIVIAYASGLGMAQMIDPSSSGNSGVITNVLTIAFGLVFIGSGGLLLFIEFFSGSFGAFPLAGFSIDGTLALKIAQEFKSVFVLGVMIALPFTAAALLLNTALAVVSKSAPAMNLFTIGFPLSVLLGILALSLVLVTLVGDIYVYALSLMDTYREFL